MDIIHGWKLQMKTMDDRLWYSVSKLIITFLSLFQTTILESRDACEIKLKKPLKFVTGRIDCNNKDEELDCVTDDNKEEYGLSDAGFVTCKAEVNEFPSILWIFHSVSAPSEPDNCVVPIPTLQIFTANLLAVLHCNYTDDS